MVPLEAVKGMDTPRLVERMLGKSPVFTMVKFELRPALLARRRMLIRSPLPDFGVVLVKGLTARQPVTDALAEHIEASFRMEASGDRARAAE